MEDVAVDGTYAVVAAEVRAIVTAWLSAASSFESLIRSGLP